MQAEWALLLEASTFEYLFSDEIQVVVRVDVTLNVPWALLLGPTVPSSCPISGLWVQRPLQTTVAFNSSRCDCIYFAHPNTQVGFKVIAVCCCGAV